MNVKEHYDRHLANIYAWMSGDFEQSKSSFSKYCKNHELSASSGNWAIDLGAGHGIQSFALAELGYNVLAVDFNDQLLNELSERITDEQIEIIQDDIRNVTRFTDLKPSLISCCGDTITHLASMVEFSDLIKNCHGVLSTNGHLLLSFRDYSQSPPENQAIIPVKSDENQILTCLLEYEKNRVRVTDLLHKKVNGTWEQMVSWYYKLRITMKQITLVLQRNSFRIIDLTDHEGLVYALACKQ